MSGVASLFKLAAGAGLVLVLAGGCGGRSHSDGADDSNHESGSSGNGNADATGGKGATNQGGTESGARDNEGGSSSTGATPNRPSSPALPACSAAPVEMDPQAPGSCAAAFRNWTHDPKTGLCMPIIYGGCGASENNYESLADCQTACPNNRPNNWDECTSGSDCALTLASCCGPSGLGPGYTTHDFVAYSPQQTGQLLLCGSGTCAAPPDDLNDERKYFVPECVQNECTVTDLRTSELTSCDDSVGCRLRMGSGCCEGCGDLIAVRNDGSFEQQVCGNTMPPCPPCVGTPPPDSARAICIGGRCSVVSEIIQ